VAFGLRARGRSRRDARQQADDLLARRGLAAQAGARATTLSGGQAQRVALLRALVTEPRLLLLDEPLAALDPSVRGETRRELRRTLDEFTGSAVVVTHDPIDALTLADDVVVIEHGTVAQAGSLGEVTSRPRSRHVADLLGTNLVRGTARGTELRSGPAVLHLAEPLEGEVFATIAPSAITVHVSEPEGSARNRWPMTVTDIEPAGERVRLRLDGDLPLVAEITAPSLAALGLQVGSPAWASVKATEINGYSR